jgi:hypothetical protein
MSNAKQVEKTNDELTRVPVEPFCSGPNPIITFRITIASSKLYAVKNGPSSKKNMRKKSVFREDLAARGKH